MNINNIPFFKKITCLCLFFSLILSFSPEIPAKAITVISDTSFDGHSDDNDKVLVTLALPSKNMDDFSFAKTGKTSFDKDITVEKSYSFGNAKDLGKSEEETNFLKDKTLVTAAVSSDKYSTSQLMKKLEKKAYVLSVERNQTIKKFATNDEYSAYQWGLDKKTAIANSKEGIKYSSVKQKATKKTPVVCVVDSGVDYTNEDLKNKMWVNTSKKISGKYGYDFGDNDADPMDNDGHGTHCAGTIAAAANNSKGIAGVCTNVKIMALKIYNQNDEADYVSTIGALNYIYKAQQAGVNIVAINCSWGVYSTENNYSINTLVNKIGKKGAIFVFSAGNYNTNRDSNPNLLQYRLDKKYVLNVGALNPDNTKAEYSDYGKKNVNIMAPGTKILSTCNEQIFSPNLYSVQKRQKTCVYYNDFKENKDISNIYTLQGLSEKYGIEDRYFQTFSMFYGKPTLVSNQKYDYDLQAKGSCVNIPISTSKKLDIFSLYLDVTDLNLDSSKKYYVSTHIGKSSGNWTSLSPYNTVTWNHQTASVDSSDFLTVGNKTYLVINELVGSFLDTFNIYIDNIGISLANPDTSQFGKYDTYSGTSMSSPYVCGAIALLANYYKNDSSVQRKERLLKCVTKSSSLSNFCSTGGYLNISKIPSVKYNTKTKVKKVKLNKKKATLKRKKKLKLKATVTPSYADNKKVKWYVSNKKYAKVSKKGVVRAKKKGVGHTVLVYAKAKDGSKKKAYCKVKIK